MTLIEIGNGAGSHQIAEAHLHRQQVAVSLAGHPRFHGAKFTMVAMMSQKLERTTHDQPSTTHHPSARIAVRSVSQSIRETTAATTVDSPENGASPHVEGSTMSRVSKTGHTPVDERVHGVPMVVPVVVRHQPLVVAVEATHPLLHWRLSCLASPSRARQGRAACLRSPSDAESRCQLHIGMLLSSI